MTALADMDVLIVDAQTTGATPALGVVLELGWGVAHAGAGSIQSAESRWIRLPEGHQVPWQVARLTGYDPTRAAVDAIDDAEGWRRLRAASAAADDVPTAIHYARFELAFLRDWARRFEPGAPFPLDAVCVHAIARRLYPDLPRRSLRALAGFLGHGVDLTRRSLGHVQATAFVWHRLCAVLADRGISEWAQLKEWLAQPAAAAAPARRGKRRYPIAPAQYRSLPDLPGVYRFLRSNGDLLYVGKAASLRKRVASHFGGRSKRELSVEMLTQVSAVRAEVTASALEAALLENETIKALQPPYNVQLVASDPRVWFCDADFRVTAQTPDEQHPIGPVPSPSSLRALHAQMALWSGGAPSGERRADAVGTSQLWTPDEAVFCAGWGIFVARHGARMTDDDGPVRARMLQLCAALLASRPFDKAADTDEGPAAENATPEWDPERVARHLERAAAQAYLAYRRSRWLRLLFDSVVVYREPDSARERRLLLRGGALAWVGDDGADPPAVTDELPRFDRAVYDRLRILTTELRRIMRDGGRVWMRPHRAIDG